jgi:hypothetical protein
MNQSEAEYFANKKKLCQESKNKPLQKLSEEELQEIKTRHNQECRELAEIYGDHHLDNIDKVDEYGTCTGCY